MRLPEDLLDRAKKAAAESERTLTEFIEDALRAALVPPAVKARECVELPTFGRDGLMPGVDLDDSAALLDLLENVE